jgi:hypothetical protein
MTAMRVLLGTVAGLGIAFTSVYLIQHFAVNVGNATAMTIAGIGGLIGGIYSAVAFARGIYGLGPFSIVGYLLDMSWSLPNTAASLLVWLPACTIAGEDFIEPDENSRRSGTFVYRENPRGCGYAATTIGTVIAGGWCSHEEVHVWQARLFGLLYLPVYALSLLLNLLFRLCTGKTEELTLQAYYRVCFEDWAYSASSTSGENINWGSWILWFLVVDLCWQRSADSGRGVCRDPAPEHRGGHRAGRLQFDSRVHADNRLVREPERVMTDVVFPGRQATRAY